MQRTIDETNRRREKQLAYNELHGITPQAIRKERNMILNDQLKPKEESTAYTDEVKVSVAADPVVQYMSKSQLEKTIENTRKLMTEAAKKFEFIEAAQYRDELVKLEELLESKK